MRPQSATTLSLQPQSTGVPKALAIPCPCRARRHNWLKSWQKSIDHADFGCAAALKLEARSDQARRLRVPPAAALTARLPFTCRVSSSGFLLEFFRGQLRLLTGRKPCFDHAMQYAKSVRLFERLSLRDHIFCVSAMGRARSATGDAAGNEAAAHRNRPVAH